MTLLQKFPYMEGILPTTKDPTYCSMPRDPVEAGRVTQVALAEHTKFLYSHVRTTEIVQWTTG
jgi:hypothetical protein